MELSLYQRYNFPTIRNYGIFIMNVMEVVILADWMSRITEAMRWIEKNQPKRTDFLLGYYKTMVFIYGICLM